MPIYYVDRSALAKLYLPEPGTDWITDLVSRETVETSVLTVPEMASALSKRWREASIAAPSAGAVHRTFLRHAMRFRMVDLDQPVLMRASEMLLAGVALRTLDALHLAAAQHSVILGAQSGLDELVMVTADRRLLAAAANAGVRIENPEDHA